MISRINWRHLSSIDWFNVPHRKQSNSMKWNRNCMVPSIQITYFRLRMHDLWMIRLWWRRSTPCYMTHIESITWDADLTKVMRIVLFGSSTGTISSCPQPLCRNSRNSLTDRWRNGRRSTRQGCRNSTLNSIRNRWQKKSTCRSSERNSPIRYPTTLVSVWTPSINCHSQSVSIPSTRRPRRNVKCSHLHWSSRSQASGSSSTRPTKETARPSATRITTDRGIVRSQMMWPSSCS